MEESQEILMGFASRASQILYDYFTNISRFFGKESEIPIFESYVLKQLPISCHTTSESVLVLVANNRLWDNEMLMRAILEGTIKFIYLTFGTNEERAIKVNEFWSILPEINKIRRSRRADDVYNYLPSNQKDDMKFIRGVVLSTEELKEIEEKYPRKYRKELEHKWSYSEIVKELSKKDQYKYFSGFFHGYGIGSHLIHQDADAINFLIDHNQRIPERRVAKEIAHGCRQISDVLTYCVLRLLAYRILFKEPIENIYLDSHNTLEQEMKKYHDNFQNVEERFLNYD